MHFASGFSWFHLIPAVGHDTLFAPLITEGTHLIVSSMMVCVGLIGLGVLARMQLERSKARSGLEKYFADDKLTARTGMELYAEGVAGLMGDMLEKEDVKKFFPLIAAIFLYLFTCNMIGTIPGFLPPTDNPNTSAGMAAIVFILFNAVGLLRDPVSYIKHLAGPIWWVVPILLPVEVLGLIIRPVTLTLRITGNMFGDHTVFGVMSELAPPVVPVAFLGLAIFVSFMQAFIFTLLTTIYISMSIPHHDEDH